MAGETLRQWLLWADTHDLPQEEIPQKLRAGETGETYGWPPRMMGDATLAMLHGQHITRTSQCIQLALCMTKEQYEAFMQGARPSWEWAHLCVQMPVVPRTQQAINVPEYQRRLRCWERDQCIANNRILEEWLLPQVDPTFAILVAGVPTQQLHVVKAAIAENNARLQSL